MIDRPLGRLEPTDYAHVDLYPLASVLPTTVTTVERRLPLPGWLASHDQGREGSCVGHAIALERALVNREQQRAEGRRRTLRYDPLDVWNEAKRIDEWDYTRPGDNNGTSVRAGYEVTRTGGLVPVRSMRTIDDVPRVYGPGPRDAVHGVAAYRWAVNVDEIRSAIANGLPVAIGVAWHRAFDTPTRRGREWWLPVPADGLGSIRGGHAVTLAGASDRRDAFLLVNSWGRDYPRVWLPYLTMANLLARGGEAAVVTDR